MALQEDPGVMQTEPAPLSEASRLSGVIAEPGKTFADIAQRPRWIVPILLLMVVSLAYSVVIGQRVGWERIARQGMEQNSSARMQDMTPEQREQAVRIGVKITTVMGYAGPLLAVPIGAWIISLAVTLVFSTFLGAKVKFPQVFSIVSYASVPRVAEIGVIIAVLFLKSPEDFDIQNPVGLNVGYFLSSDWAPKWLISFASSFDIMSFWIMALMVIGLSAAAPKSGRGKAMTAVVGPWAVYLLAKTALSAIRG